ncbi:hypothetical protein KP509_04G019000 [Ceratopteris richardii]|uniref:indole-3-glycerol-phosphate synthase n=1 Tax=Ceratopteris richardii TaxID=49495 RepID=A0A8T2UY88_CERRI|nr:hypothetical protein KP509_04G019000 [Ceratopteris richardii]
MEAFSAFIGQGCVYATMKVAFGYDDHHFMKIGNSLLQVQSSSQSSRTAFRFSHASCASSTPTNEGTTEFKEKRYNKDHNALPSSSYESPEYNGWQEKEEEEMLINEGISIRRRSATGSPRNKLEEIIWSKDIEVMQMKEKMPLNMILEALPGAPPPRDFVGALRKRAAETNLPALIAEVKKASPSRGVIQSNFDPVRIAQAYEKGGAACISVLTDSKYFQGDFEYLKRVRNAGVQCPLLCKEFIIDEWQIYFARLHGADAVLLIAAVLPDQDLKYMSNICKKLGIVALVEVHNSQEMDRVLGIDGIDLVGINNRNLETFEVDIKNTANLLRGNAGHIIREQNILVVGESGLFTPQDIAVVQNAGVNAVLVGESLVKQDDPVAGITALFGKDMSLSSLAGGFMQ